MHDHVIPIGEFGMWRSFCVRGAGMPYDWLARGPDAVTREPRFIEAIQWQNPLVASLLRKGVTGKKARRLTRTLWTYAARYCAKNDTIGYFGFKTWGEWAPQTRLGRFEPPPRGPVYLELWAVRALADALEERHGLSPWTVPHVAPGVAVDVEGAHLMDGSVLPLSPEQRATLDACDGFRTAAELGDVRRLQAMGLLTRGFAVHQGRHPERQLKTQLFRVADPVRREAALRDLAEVTDARHRLQQSLGDPDAHAEALRRLDATFGRVSGQAAERRPGEYYAGRGLAFEDCVSTRETRLGTRVLDAVAPALELLLISARWYSYQVAREYQAAVATMTAGGPVPLPHVLARLQDTFYERRYDPGGPASAAAAELRKRWSSILTGTHASSALLRQVREQFAAPGPGWPGARWHSPDLMLAARSPDDLETGDFLAVLGELHPTINTLDSLSFLSTHPDQRAVRRWIDADMPDRMVPLYPQALGVNSRTAPPEGHHSAGYTYLGVGAEPSYHPRRARLVPVSALTVHPDGLVRGPGFEAPLPHVLGDYLALAAHNRFGLLEHRPHQPRVTIDRLVVARETWRAPVAAGPPRDLPRLVFAKLTGEVKPFYVDFGDPILADVLDQRLRRARERHPDGEAVFTEMLPGPGHLWLRDGDGNRYTTELRLVCVDFSPCVRSALVDREGPGRA